MRKLATASLSLLMSAFLGAGTVVDSAVAQDKAGNASVKMTVLLENDKVKAYEATYEPGAENTAVATSATRVVRALNAGKLQRSYADGKKEDVAWKSGEVKLIPPGPAYTTKNVGKSALHLYVVQLK
jgi:mannose-6-phosphate isomerase-like protein (cupin superfamily)